MSIGAGLGSVVLIGALALGLAPASHADTTTTAETLDTLLNTKLSPVYLTADHKQSITRSYDTYGRLVERVFTDDSVSPIRIERTRIQYNPEHIERSEQRGVLVLLRETQWYSDTGYMIMRKTYTSSKGDGVLDRLETESPAGTKRTIAHFVADAGSYKEVDRIAARRFFEAAPSAASLSYASCLWPDKKGDELAACASELDAPLATVWKSVGPLSSNTCVSDGTLFEPSGVRVDLSSCAPNPSDTPAGAASNKKSLDAIGSSLGGALTGVLACLNDMNPKASQKFTSMLQVQRPMVYCGGRNDPALQSRMAALNCPGGSGITAAAQAACVADTKQSLVGSATKGPVAAFADVGGKTGLYLGANGDPNIMHPELGDKTSDDAATRIANGGQSCTMSMDGAIADRIQAASATCAKGNLPSLLFHEMLHLAGFPCPDDDNPKTGHSPDNPNDSVYACQGVCGGPQRNVSRESCMTCAKAFGNAPTQSAVDACKKNFAPIAVLNTIKTLARPLMGFDACRDQIKKSGNPAADNPTCKWLMGQPDFKVCAAKGLAVDSDDCLAAIKDALRAKVTALQADEGFQAVQNNWPLLSNF